MSVPDAIRLCTEHGYLCFQDSDLWICPEDGCGADARLYVRAPESFNDLQAVVQASLDYHYPRDLMERWPHDPGPKFILALRDALDALP